MMRSHLSAEGSQHRILVTMSQQGEGQFTGSHGHEGSKATMPDKLTNGA